jgi:hypothetical protein
VRRQGLLPAQVPGDHKRRVERHHDQVMQLESADRIPNEEFGCWEETLERWRSEGMPADADEELYFGLDIRRERRLLPINTTGPIPGLGFRIRTLDDFERAKAHYNPHSPERYPADWSERVEADRQRDYPLGLNVNGFFGQPRDWLGLGCVCVAYYEDPKLMHATTWRASERSSAAPLASLRSCPLRSAT